MRAKMIWAAVVTSLVGCGGSAMRAPVASAPVAAPALASTDAASEPSSVRPAIEEEPQAIAELDPSTLPEAPWSEPPLTTHEVPPPILAAWERAENRDNCAPIAPRSFGAAEGARARASELEGGWAVEFDRRGMRGVMRDGTLCEACGRGVFGLAGTAMSPEEIAGEHSDTPAPSFRDGSHAELEVSDSESIAAATITVAGEGCVYQVWSFLGQDHVEELVRELRRIELPAARTSGTLARADR